MAGSGDLEQSLRAEVESYINGRLSGLREDIERLHSQVNEAFTRLSERLTSETQTDASVAVAISEHLRAARTNGMETATAESSRARASSDVAILKAAIEDIDNQRAQGDILNALVNRAASFAPRIAFFIVKNDRATGWRARGLEGTVGDEAVREISLPLSSDTLLSEAARSRSSWSGSPGVHAEDHTILGGLGGEPPQRIVAVPLIARERSVAVLYADSAALDSDAINLEALEMLVRVAGMAVELLAVKRPAPAEAGRVTPPPSTTEAKTPAATSSYQPSSAAAPPESLASEPPPSSYAEPAASSSDFSLSSSPAEQPAAPPESAFTMPPPVTDTVAAGSAGGFEFTADSGTPSAATSTTDASSSSRGAPSRRYGRGDAELPIEVGEDEKRFHNDARRFARLLISEIKLYNEQKVKEGRTEGDLYERLREDIDRSRQMYDKRVAPQVAGRYDYFHHELVNTLAEGDPAKLGESYPGAAVSH